MEYRHGPELSIPQRFRIKGWWFEHHRTPKNYFRLDLIFVQLIDNVTSHGTIGKIADHKGVFITFHCTHDKPKERLQTIYDYSKVDKDGLIKYIKKI